jgi:hypothetical protein
LLRKEGFALLFVGTLGLGIAGHTALLGVVEGVVFHPLAYPHDTRIRLATLVPRVSTLSFGILPDKRDREIWAASARSLDDVEAFGFAKKVVSGGGFGAQVMTVGLLSPGMMHLAGRRPVAGRGFVGTDTASSATRVVLLSEGFWMEAFGGQQAAIGGTIDVDSIEYSIFGVLHHDLQLHYKCSLCYAV